MMTIESVTGRELEDLSFYPEEREVVFRPYTTFMVRKIEKKDDIYHIDLAEAHPDIRGRKVLVWVDDGKTTECKTLMNNCEKIGVTCVLLHSTENAKDFFKRQDHLFRRGIDRLRIITDMVRTEEDGKQNIEAGLELVKYLKDEKNYTQGILVFTGSEYLGKNQKKFRDAGLPHVYATWLGREAQNFGNFNKELPGHLQDYSSETPPKLVGTPSSSSSSIQSTSS